MDAQAELGRLTAALGKALGATARAHVLHCADDCVYVNVGDRNRCVDTAMHPTADEAVAELRAILRADTDGAVADVLDELAALSEEGPLTAEMLRAMAAARRSR